MRKLLEGFKLRAHRAVRSAIKRGDLIRPKCCSRCGLSPMKKNGISGIEAHHHDYIRPLEVEWLCPTCHRRISPKAVYTTFPPGVKGERNGQAKLTSALVLMIRESALPLKALARRLGVDRNTVRRAKRGELWSHV